MLIHILLFCLMVSFTIHALSLIFYFIDKSIKFFYTFLATVFINMSLGIAISIYAFKYPARIRSIDYDLILWIISGLVMLMMVSLKGVIVAKIFKRIKDPANYSYNYFGKKVYSKNIVTYPELGTIFLTAPFFLFIGAYFVAKLFHFLSVK